MVQPLSHREIEELLGAYALDAVDGDEAVQVADHLLECARCRAEVAEHREVAALLAQGGSPAPADLWDRIAATIEGTGPSEQDTLLVAPPPLFSRPASASGRPGHDRRSRSWRSRAALPLAAVAAGLLAVLGVQVVDRLSDQDRRISELVADDGLDRALRSAMDDPDAELVELRSTDGSQEVSAWLTGTTGYLHAAGLPELPEERTYQLWADLGESRISLGVLGHRPEVTRFELSEDVLGLAITEETASGVVVSDQAPVVYAVVPTDA